MDSLHLFRPAWLLALVPLAISWRWLCRGAKDNRRNWLGIVDSHLLAHLVVKDGHARRGIALSFLAVAWLLAVLALAGPGVRRQPAVSGAPSRMQAVVVGIPAAGQLSAGERTGFSAVKEEALGLIDALPDRETALILYAGQPFLVVPPTLDRETVRLMVTELAPGLLPVSGHRPERAVEMAEEVSRRNRFGGADIYLVTAAEGMLSQSGKQSESPRLSIYYYGADDGVAARLRGLAEQSGGRFARRVEGRGDIRSLLEPSTTDTEPVHATAYQTEDWGYWFVLAILPLALLAFRPGLLMVVLAGTLGGATGWPGEAVAGGGLAVRLADIRAWQDLQSGRLDESATGFSDPCWRAAATYRGRAFAQAAELWKECPGGDAAYNRGNALAHAGKYKEALAAYDQALRTRPQDGDFQFNRKLVQDMLQQSSQPPTSGAKAPKGSNQSANALAPGRGSSQEVDAARLAEQWRQAVPDQPQDLLRRKIELEYRRRLTSGTDVPKSN